VSHNFIFASNLVHEKNQLYGSFKAHGSVDNTNDALLLSKVWIKHKKEAQWERFHRAGNQLDHTHFI